MGQSADMKKRAGFCIFDNAFHGRGLVCVYPLVDQPHRWVLGFCLCSSRSLKNITQSQWRTAFLRYKYRTSNSLWAWVVSASALDPASWLWRSLFLVSQRSFHLVNIWQRTCLCVRDFDPCDLWATVGHFVVVVLCVKTTTTTTRWLVGDVVPLAVVEYYFPPPHPACCPFCSLFKNATISLCFSNSWPAHWWGLKILVVGGQCTNVLRALSSRRRRSSKNKSQTTIWLFSV
jgi:hypothetical protein